MSFTALDSMGKTSLMLDLISQRQRALGSNVANVDTPGYVRKDIDFSTYKKPSKIYGNSKRFLMFALFELFKNKTNASLAIVHPGITLTNMTNHYPKAINWLVKIGIKLFFPHPKKASLSIIKGTNISCDYHEWIGPKLFNVWGYPIKRKLTTCSEKESKEIYKIAEHIFSNLQ